jgi:dipeptidyl aminopeptidase/acylaminoacyl peptidase
MLRRAICAFAVLCAASQLALLSGAAQSPRAMGLVDLLNVPRLADPRVSPDGRDILFTRAESDWKAGKRISHIWRARIGATAAVQLTSGADGENAPRWSPDGKTIAFTSKRGDNEFAQIYLLPVDGGEARQLTTHASAVSEISWSPDGASLYFSAADAKTADEKARDRLRDDVYAYDENYKQTHLWKVAVATKTEAAITSGSFSMTSYSLSDDGKKVVASDGASLWRPDSGQVLLNFEASEIAILYL